MRRDTVAGRCADAGPERSDGDQLPSSITVKDLADLLAVNPGIIRELIKSGIFANINQGIDARPQPSLRGARLRSGRDRQAAHLLSPTMARPRPRR